MLPFALVCVFQSDYWRSTSNYREMYAKRVSSPTSMRERQARAVKVHTSECTLMRASKHGEHVPVPVWAHRKAIPPAHSHFATHAHTNSAWVGPCVTAKKNALEIILVALMQGIGWACLRACVRVCPKEVASIFTRAFPRAPPWPMLCDLPHRSQRLSANNTGDTWLEHAHACASACWCV